MASRASWCRGGTGWSAGSPPKAGTVPVTPCWTPSWRSSCRSEEICSGAAAPWNSGTGWPLSRATTEGTCWTRNAWAMAGSRSVSTSARTRRPAYPSTRSRRVASSWAEAGEAPVPRETTTGAVLESCTSWVKSCWFTAVVHVDPSAGAPAGAAPGMVPAGFGVPRPERSTAPRLEAAAGSEVLMSLPYGLAGPVAERLPRPGALLQLGREQHGLRGDEADLVLAAVRRDVEHDGFGVLDIHALSGAAAAGELGAGVVELDGAALFLRGRGHRAGQVGADQCPAVRRGEHVQRLLVELALVPDLGVFVRLDQRGLLVVGRGDERALGEFVLLLRLRVPQVPGQ